MKIFNYMNNTNSIMEKNTDKVQKGNSQTNEKHTVGQSVKLSISNEGLEYYRNRIQQSGQEKYDDAAKCRWDNDYCSTFKGGICPVYRRNYGCYVLSGYRHFQRFYGQWYEI